MRPVPAFCRLYEQFSEGTEVTISYYLESREFNGRWYNLVNDPNPLQMWKSYSTAATTVALPWVNNNSGNIQNEVTYQGNGSYKWNTSYVSLQPYLLQGDKQE